MKSTSPRHIARTNVMLDARLVNRVKRLASVKTTREAIHLALDHYIRSRDSAAVLKLRGSGGVTPGYDPKVTSPVR